MQLQTSSSLSVGGNLNGKVEIKVSVDMGRLLTEDESDLIQKFRSDLMKMIGINDTLSSDQYKSDVQFQRESILVLFGDTKVFVQEIPNEYGRAPLYPWYIVYTHKGPIKIGSRKRVLSIEWPDSTIKESAEELFPDEDTTKYGKLIHAWGYEKAAEYINKLLQHG